MKTKFLQRKYRSRLPVQRDRLNAYGLLGLLTKSGVPILQGLNLVIHSCERKENRDLFDKIHHAVREGCSIVEPMVEAGVPSLETAIIDLGEQTGQLPDILDSMSRVGVIDFKKGRGYCFAYWMEILLRAGLSQAHSLRVIASNTEKWDKVFSEAVSCLSKDVGGGHTLSEALSKYDFIFSKSLVSFVRVGEQSGILEVIFRKYLERCDGPKIPIADYEYHLAFWTAVYVNAGEPLVRVLRTISGDFWSVDMNFSRIVRCLGDDIEQGETFSGSLGKHPDVFSKVFINMVKAGELGGVLEVCLDRIVKSIEGRYEEIEKAKGPLRKFWDGVRSYFSS